MPLTELALRARQPVPGGVVGASMARAAAAEVREERARAVADPDERAANLISRGYAPGAISQLSGRLAETEAELADEEAKIAKAAKRAARVQRDFAADKIGMAELLAAQDDGEGDSRKVEKLQRRAESLRRQIREAAEASMPRAAHEANAVEAAVQRSREALAEVARLGAEEDAAAARSRAKMAADRREFYRARGGTPFGDSGAGAPLTEADCEVCSAARAGEAQRAIASHGEITRVTDADGMGQMGTLSGTVSYR